LAVILLYLFIAVFVYEDAGIAEILVDRLLVDISGKGEVTG
jgi:hypothetical protein